MPRPPAAPKNLRNGLKWRHGRPRWEPSPANRKAGIKGMDLRHPDRGAWLDRGAAIDASDARTKWAARVREAAAGDAKVLDALRTVLERLEAPSRTAEDALRRHFLADLIDAARALCSAPEAPIEAMEDPHSVRALRQAYLDDPEVVHPVLGVDPSTVAQYAKASLRLVDRFGRRRADSLTPAEMRSWYVELVDQRSVSTANLVTSAAGAIFKWGVQHDWLPQTPLRELGRRKAPGRRVFWTFDEEAAFVPWCDANGYEDVADAVVILLWTGARQDDLARAGRAAFGTTWRYTPHKTHRNKREAMAGVLPQVRARLDRPRPVANLERRAIHHPDGTSHDSLSIGDRFREARAAAIAGGAMPEAFALKMLKDTRKTCVTRLFLSGQELTRISTWTGHAPDEAADILREHYLVLQEDGAIAMAEQLQAWADKQGVQLDAH